MGFSVLKPFRITLSLLNVPLQTSARSDSQHKEPEAIRFLKIQKPGLNKEGRHACAVPPKGYVFFLLELLYQF